MTRRPTVSQATDSEEVATRVCLHASVSRPLLLLAPRCLGIDLVLLSLWPHGRIPIRNKMI